MPASYPSAPKSFTPIIDGVDYPQADHQNVAYDEITAIEQALLTSGVAHVVAPDATGNNRDLGTSARKWRDVHLSGAVNAATVTLTGEAALNGGAQLADALVQRPLLKDYAESMTAVTGVSGALAVDLENGNTVDVTLTGDVTSFTISNPPATGQLGGLTVIVRSGGSARTFAWGSSVKWAGGTAPTLSTGNDVITLITVDGGTVWLGFVSGQDFA